MSVSRRSIAKADRYVLQKKYANVVRLAYGYVLGHEFQIEKPGFILSYFAM
jgi:hypothetical protein